MFYLNIEISNRYFGYFLMCGHAEILHTHCVLMITQYVAVEMAAATKDPVYISL